MCPPDPRLLTQQGGCLVFGGERLVLKHVDSGILRYTDVDAVLKAALGADYAPTISVEAAIEVMEE